MVRFVDRAWARLAPMLAAALLVSACGGGGGGGGGGDGNDGGAGLRVTLDRNSMAFDYRDDAVPAAAQVVATATGTIPNPLYMLATDEGGALDPEISTVFTSTTATFSVRPRAGLTAGTHSGRLLLTACTDMACRNAVGGTPLSVAYAITVRPSLKVTPPSLLINAVGGQPVSATLDVQLPEGASAATVVSALPAWLGARADGARIVLTAAPWRSGNYSTMLDIVAGTEHRFVPITFVVSVPPDGERDLSLDATGLSFTTSENARSAAQAVTVNRPSWTPSTAVPWHVEYTSGSGWLQVSDTPRGVSVLADAAALSRGSYQATLVFEPAAPAIGVRLPVSVSVGPGLVAPPAVVLTAHAETSASTLRGQWTVQSVAGPAFTWRASASQPWLRLSATSGSTGDQLDYSVDPAAAAALANFADHQATVTLTPDAAHITPVTVPVTLAKRLPEVLGVGPQLLLTGRTTVLNVSGRGFDALAAPAARLQVGGVAPDSVTRLNDRTLQVRLTPQLPATPTVSVGNGLGEARASATLRVISPQALGYAAVTSGGNPRSIVYDAARLAVYGVNVQGETLQRFRFQNGSWVLDAVPIPQILDAGLSADGESIVVTATPGRLRLLDPATLETTFTLDHPAGFSRDLTYVGFGIGTTHDGRSWLPIGSGGWNEFGYFDLHSRSIQPRPEQIDFRSSFHGGPWSAVSRDGSRMIVVQSASISPSPPMLGYSPVTGVLAPEASGQTFAYDIHLSADGSRAIFDGREVRDRDGALIGVAALDAFPGYIGLVGLMSPEGHQAYVLAMHTNAGVKPRVFVFDTRAVNPSSTALALVGQFDLADDPTCRTTAYECNWRARAAISPDGGTLFFLGDRNLVVQPVDAALRALGGSRADARSAGGRPRAWQAPSPSR